MKTLSLSPSSRSVLFLPLLAAGVGFAMWGQPSSLLAQPAGDTPPATDPATDGSPASEYEASRYDRIRVKSPFEFELAKPKPEEAVDPFQDLILAGYAGSGKQISVYLVNAKTQERLTIPGGNEGSETGFRVITVNRGRTLRTTTATLEKNGVTKELSFDPKALSSMVASGGSSGAGAPGGARPGVPGQPGIPGQAVRPGGVNPPNAAVRQTPYVAPAAFIPGANNNANGGAVANGNPPGPVNLTGNMVNGNPQPAAGGPQPNGNPAPGVNQSNNQPRRRVVLPTQR